MNRLWQDLRYALRVLAMNPGFTTVAVLTLALGIGANTAIFTVLDAVLLRSLPVSHPEQLALLTDPDEHGAHFGSETGGRSLVAYSEFQYLQSNNQVFTKMCAMDSSLAETEITITFPAANSHKQKEVAEVRMVSGDYFDTLSIKPAAGNLFGPEVDRARGAAPVAVISYGYWKRRFGLTPAAIGQSVAIHNTSFEISGVTQPGFFGETVGESPDVWVPLTMQGAIYPGKDFLSASTQGIVNQYMWLQVLGRLKPDVTLAQANAGINAIFKTMLESNAGALSAEERKHALDQRIDVQAGGRGASTLHGGFGEPLKFLMILVGLVLLIACTNVANLLLARGTARYREFAVRLAIGANRRHLIRQLLTETLVLAAAGAAAGILVAQWADLLLLRMVFGDPGQSGMPLDLHLDLRVLAFTLGLTLITAILFGVMPSIYVTRALRNITPMIKSGTMETNTHSGSRRLPFGKVLVIAQVAVSVVLLMAAALTVRSLAKLGEVNLGYGRENLLLFRVDAVAGGYKGAAATQVYEQLLEKLKTVPGIRSVTMSHNGLFSHSESGDPVWVEGYTPKADERVQSRFDHIGPGYFSSLGIPILSGREIDGHDTKGSLRAAVINQTFARRFLANTNPIGKRLRDVYPGNPADMQIVGVVADAKYNSLREETPPRIYVPLANPVWDVKSAVYEVRTYAAASTLSDTLRETVRQFSPALPAVEVRAMSGLVDDSLETDRFIERLAGGFGALAILLAGVGIYGIMAYTVARRTRDIGIRLALGAEPGSVLRRVVGETLLLVAIGTVIGLPLAIGAARVAKSILFGLSPADPLAIVFAIASLALCALIAGFLPARRASTVDPIVALRYE